MGTARGMALLNWVYLYLRSIIPAAVLWYLIAVAIGNPAMLPTPVDVARALVSLLKDKDLLYHALDSLRRIAVGYGMAVVVGVPLGLAMGLFPPVHDLIDPVIELLRPISGIAWIPLALLIFGIGDDLTIFILVYGSIFPVVVNTLAGVRGCDPRLVQAAQTFGVGRWAMLTQVIWPAALPAILVGARIAMGTAWMAIVAAELVGAPTGLGFAIEWYRELLMTPKVVAVIMVVGLLGYLSDLLLRQVRRRLTPWAVGQKVGE